MLWVSKNKVRHAVEYIMANAMHAQCSAERSQYSVNLSRWTTRLRRLMDLPVRLVACAAAPPRLSLWEALPRHGLIFESPSCRP